MTVDPPRDPDALGRIWRASPKARAELEANLRMLDLARQQPVDGDGLVATSWPA